MSKTQKKSQRQVTVTNKKTGETQQLVSTENNHMARKMDESQSLLTRLDDNIVNNDFVAKKQTDRSIKTELVKKKEPETLELFIETFYAGKIKSLPEDRVKKLKKQAFEIDSREKLVISSSISDSSLDKTRHLLTLLAELKTSPTFQHSVSEFIRDVVVRHPIMISHSAQLWLPMSGSADEANLTELFETIGTVKKLRNDEKSKKYKDDLTESESKSDSNKPSESDKKMSVERQKARLNAFYIALLWRYSKKFLSFSELIRALRSTVYKLQINKSDIEGSLIDFFVTAQGKEAFSISSLMQWYADQSRYDKDVADMARRKVDNLTEQLEETKGLLAAAQSEIEGLSEQVDSLHKQVKAAHEKERVQGIHSRADQQFQKGRTLRILEEEIPILSDCLKALERDPPKILVAKEYMGSVFEKLSKELNALKGEQ